MNHGESTEERSIRCVDRWPPFYCIITYPTRGNFRGIKLSRFSRFSCHPRKVSTRENLACLESNNYDDVITAAINGCPRVSVPERTKQGFGRPLSRIEALHQAIGACGRLLR